MKRVEEKRRSTWVIVLCCFLMVFTSLGFCSSPKQLFLKAITDALGLKRSLFSLNDSLRFIATAVLSIFFGRLVMKLGTKKMILLGFGLLIGSQVLYGVADTLPVFYLGGVLLGAGLSFVSSTTASYIIKRRCTKNVGTLQGLVLAANGLGGALAMQMVSPFIESSPLGYRKAYWLVAVVLAVAAAVVLLLYREDPEPAAPPPDKKARGQSWEGISFAQGLKSPYFYACGVLVFLTGTALSGINGIAATHMKDVGIDADLVKNILSSHSLALMCCKFFAGFVYDRKGIRVTLIMCQLASVIVLVALALAANNPFGIGMAWVYGLLSTLALPLETIGVSLVAGDLFGNRDFAKYLGLLSGLNYFGYAAGSPVTNLVYDVCGTYRPAILAGAGIMVAVGICFQFVVTAAHKRRDRQGVN